MEEVLLLAKFEAGKMEASPETIDLLSFGQSLVDEVSRATLGSNPIELEVHPEARVALADERLLRHVFMNLLTNAVKYSLAGQPVGFTISRDAAEAIMQVRDSGVGIPEGDLEWIFQAFHRAGNVGARPGTGLGLVIAKRCVELHGGTIAIESILGKGTTVTVRLPLYRVTSGDA